MANIKKRLFVEILLKYLFKSVFVNTRRDGICLLILQRFFTLYRKESIVGHRMCSS